MTEKQFRYGETDLFEWVEDNGKMISTKECVNKLNKQQATIITLKRRLEKINGGYGHLTYRNGLTANEWLIESQEKELKKKNEQISNWIEQHSKDIVTIGEQQDNINRLEEENEQLKQFKQNVFGLIDKSLEKDKYDYEMTYEDYLNGRIEVLEDLKKKLKGWSDE